MVGATEVRRCSNRILIGDGGELVPGSELKLVEGLPGGFEAEAEIPSQGALEERHGAVPLAVIGDGDISLDPLSHPLYISEVAQTPEPAEVHLEPELVGILSDPVAELVAEVLVARQIVPVLVIPWVDTRVLKRHIKLRDQKVKTLRAECESQPLVIEPAVKKVAEVDHINVSGAVEEEVLREAHLEVGKDHPVPVIGGNSSRVVVHHLVIEEGDEGLEAEIGTIHEGVAQRHIKLFHHRKSGEVGNHILVFVGNDAARAHALRVAPERRRRVVDQRINPPLIIIEAEPAYRIGVEPDLRKRRRLG